MQTAELTNKMITAIELQTKAIMYLANVLGHKADDLNPPAADGNGRAVKLELNIQAPEETAPLVEITLDDVKDCLNRYAKKHGKELTFALLEKYKATKPADIEKAMYGTIIKEIEAAL